MIFFVAFAFFFVVFICRSLFPSSPGNLSDSGKIEPLPQQRRAFTPPEKRQAKQAPNVYLVGLAAGIVLALLVVAVVVAIIPKSGTEKSSAVVSEPASPDSSTTNTENSGSAVLATTENSQPAQTSEINGNLVGVFTTNSDGHVWNSATESAKRELCRRLAAASQSGNTASFYYDLIDGTYNTTDENVLQQRIDFVVRFGDASRSQ